MPKITVLPHSTICPQGKEFETSVGSNLCKALLENDVPIEHACDMSCACTTCHLIVRKGFYKLKDMTDIEADLLDRAWGLEPESRLSCQVKVENDDLTVELPRYTINHASENH